MTQQEIDSARSAKGGWTRETLAAWGVPWPPPRGWRRRLISEGAAPKVQKKCATRSCEEPAMIVCNLCPACRKRRDEAIGEFNCAVRVAKEKVDRDLVDSASAVERVRAMVIELELWLNYP